MTTPVLELDNVSKLYPVYDGVVMRRQVGAVRAVENVSFSLQEGKTLAIVGETGCGKSTTARLAMRLIEPSAGQIRFEGRDITHASRTAMNPLRQRMQIVFQDPYASLNPRMTIGEILTEPLAVHRVGTAQSRAARVEQLLRLVDLAPYHAQRYPHQFSGGQRQRVGIARALALSPKLIVCDEPVSALDVSIQAQIINLLKDLQKTFGFSYLFISHGLAVVRHIADRVGVMYLGQMVEIADKHALYENPRHPYTQALLMAAPDPNPAARLAHAPVVGDIPSAINPPSGCRFHTRCPMVQDRCKSEVPILRHMAPGHQTACHYAELAPVYQAARHDQSPTPGLLARQAVYAARRVAAS